MTSAIPVSLMPSAASAGSRPPSTPSARAVPASRPAVPSRSCGALCSALDGNQLYDALGAKELRRCPGSNERGLSSDQLTQGGTVDCDPTETPIGP